MLPYRDGVGGVGKNLVVENFSHFSPTNLTTYTRVNFEINHFISTEYFHYKKKIMKIFFSQNKVYTCQKFDKNRSGNSFFQGNP